MLRIDCFHFGHDVGHFVFGGQIAVVGVPWERQKVFYAIDAFVAECFRTCKCAHQMVRLPTGGTPQLTMAAVVTALDHEQVDISEFIQILMPVGAYFAYELTVSVVGAGAFFAASSFSASVICSASFWSWSATILGTPYHSERRLMTVM